MLAFKWEIYGAAVTWSNKPVWYNEGCTRSLSLVPDRASNTLEFSEWKECSTMLLTQQEEVDRLTSVLVTRKSNHIIRGLKVWASLTSGGLSSIMWLKIYQSCLCNEIPIKTLYTEALFSYSPKAQTPKSCACKLCLTPGMFNMAAFLNACNSTISVWLTTQNHTPVS